MKDYAEDYPEEAVEVAHDTAMNNAEGPMDPQEGCAQSTASPEVDKA